MRRFALVGVLLTATAARGDSVRWPHAIALGWYDRKDVHVPVLTTRPPAVGRSLSRWFRDLPRPVTCDVDLLAPYAIDVTCRHGGRSTRELYWLEHGYPPIKAAEFGLDIGVFDTGCPVDCRFDVDHFALGTDGLTFVPTTDCVCADLPTIPFDELEPRDQRAHHLIDWLSARAAAGAGPIAWSLDE